MVGDEDVQEVWRVLAIDIDSDEEADELLFDLVDMWVTMRGFALVSMWMEEYKRAKDKTVDKSKALRKELELEASEA